ncbi:Hemerythrin HHE cation binding domain protein [Novipirellula aureliae]|uniref:Hemerythrin HHE cation binding domain protein n=1 Tax=Novipirellula aureliae TaxID=2527966 RepID=A0A5C6EEB8_9BACT|nr:hemerythrin domain-containing protein [Novipirellula aureliae]TWU45886.1 Hemerythrin HHE cation binding domain protein [Novipirellula aureliae]
MTVQINAKPLADFDRPIDMLVDCHRRIEHFLGVIVRVLERYASQPLDSEARQALAAALQYFKISAPKHTADEEQSLFPRMQSVGAITPKTNELLEQLRQDHQTADELQGRIDRILEQWLASDDSLPADSLATLRADLAELKNHYAAHIHMEEEQIFPSAAKALSENQLREMGTEMRSRRGLGNDRHGK